MIGFTLATDQEKEVEFVSGVTSSGKVSGTAFDTWNGAEPPSYNSSSGEAKWGAGTAGANATITFGFDAASGWSPTERAAFTSTLALWSAVANVNFVLVSDATTANIDFKRGSDGSASEQHSYYRGGGIASSRLGVLDTATVSIDTSVGGFGPIGSSNFDNYGGYPWEVMLHEEGHALGLGHAGPYNDGTSSAAEPYQLTAYDTRQWSIMSYIEPSDKNAPFYSSYAYHTAWGSSSGSASGAPSNTYYGDDPTTWMPLDILAAQRLYGIALGGPLGGGQIFGFNTNIDTSIRQFFDFTVNIKPVVTLWDSGVGNTLDLSGFSSASIVNLNGGQFSSVAGLTNNLAIGFGVAIDHIIGGPGADTLMANDDGDVLTGGGGSDLLIGGLGADVFADTTAGHRGDAITKFGSSDRIWLTDENYSSFSYTFSYVTPANASPNALLIATMSYAGNGGFSVSNYALQSAALADPIRFHHLILSQDANGGVDLTYGGMATRLSDLNADGHSDIVWRDASGAFSIWDITGNASGAVEHPSVLYGSVDPGWQLQGAFDFDGDGRADLYWRNTTTGVTTIWTSTANGLQANTDVIVGVDSSWSMAAIGDFNGDGQADILWRNSASGVISEWQANNTIVSGAGGAGFAYSPAYASNVYVNGGVDTSWHIQAVGDFNGDGKDDLLWRNSNGVFTTWDSTGLAFTSNIYVSASVDTTWHVAGVGDFNGDGKDDLLWRNNNGTFTIWTSTGASFIPNTFYSSSVDPSWSIAQIGDFNDDGKADILFRNSATGVFAEWDSNGSGFTTNVLVDGSVGTSWSIVSHHFDIV
jgi:hypothetical protein